MNKAEVHIHIHCRKYVLRQPALPIPPGNVRVNLRPINRAFNRYLDMRAVNGANAIREVWPELVVLLDAIRRVFTILRHLNKGWMKHAHRWQYSMKDLMDS
jgi:hypothetical protein